jgi:Kef-type K+ transport system membrane component KefB
MSKAIYDNFVNKDAIPYNHFLVFVCVSYSITAFPVLCRILTELKLLDSQVGVCVLSAGIGNDILGWTLLALVVALVNASNGLTALYIILCAAGWALFMLFPVRLLLHLFARKSGSTTNGPSMLFMTIIIMTVFASAFFTDIIGVHAIFGGFLAGLCVPREGGLNIAMTEKFEDMITIVFLPLVCATRLLL